MNTLQILPDHGQTAFEPGSTVTGLLAWSLETQVRSLEFTVGWHTEGRGLTDSDVHHSQTIKMPPQNGSEAFTFVLPQTPWSFRGKLLQVIWLMELSAPEIEVLNSLPIVVAAGGVDIQLPVVELVKKPGGIG